ncbi:hypothetical protein NQ315_012028 [Exocentrus adspersus]|uniref:Uncharacterized protein n=1 Tax=Exocentrus adspersus TaxID=1586481 RepID=A0AAV8VIQ6_9CUCU|nr:hypothetical protein NQ315_012028 [Exocentrus adspersus]
MRVLIATTTSTQWTQQNRNNGIIFFVALIIGVSGACWTDELVKMKMLDVAFFEKKKFRLRFQIPKHIKVDHFSLLIQYG